MAKKKDEPIAEEPAQDTTPDTITVEEAIAHCERITKISPVHGNDLGEVIRLLRSL